MRRGTRVPHEEADAHALKYEIPEIHAMCHNPLPSVPDAHMDEIADLAIFACTLITIKT